MEKKKRIFFWIGVAGLVISAASGTVVAEPVWPVVARISSGYSSSRTVVTNNGRQSRPHYGIDFSVPTGTAICACDDGTVIRVANKGTRGGGRYIIVQHDDGWISEYMHLSEFRIDIEVPPVGTRRNLKEGERVRVTRGEVIALSGNTGNTTGPHLHFGVKQNGRYKNPMDYLGPSQERDLRGTVKVRGVNARICPAVDSDWRATLSRRQLVKITGEHEGWYEIEVRKGGSTRKAWIRSRHVKIVDNQTKGEVTAWGLNARKGASTACAIIGGFSRGDRVEILDIKGRWYQVRVNRDGEEVLGWIHGAYVKIVPGGNAGVGISGALGRSMDDR